MPTPFHAGRLAREEHPGRPDRLFLPAAHRRRLRTINSLERLSREIKRRTRVVSIFPNEAACLRLISAVLMEIDEEWQTDRIYLTLETDGSL